MDPKAVANCRFFPCIRRHPRNPICTKPMTLPPTNPARAKLRLAYLMAALPPLFWSGNFLVARIMHDTIPPFQMSFWRWVTAFLIFLPFLLMRIREDANQLKAEWRSLAILGLIGVTAFNCFIYAALHHTTVVNATLINSLTPVATFLFALLFLRDRLTPQQLLGVAISIGGAATIIARGDFNQVVGLNLNRGDILVVGGLLFWALYTVLIKWRPTGLPLITFVGATVGFGTLFHVPMVAWELRTVGAFDVTWATAGAILYFGVFPSVLAYVLWNKAVAILGPGRTGMFIYLLPIFSTVLGVWFLDEPFHLYHGAGMALIFAGIYLVTRSTSPQT